MENIELTEDHKVKLLEMCKSLFSKYKFTLEESCQLGAYSYNFNNIIYSKLDEKEHLYKGKEIYWFEFCWTILNKILESELSPIKSMNIINNFGLVCFNQLESHHPINYLYEEFKKLK